MGFAGSSPRAWGTQADRFRKPHWCGLIPTGVGNTHSSSCSCWVSGAHPHGRGEHRDLLLDVRQKQGSSPRAWGTHTHPASVHDHSGLIPTGVGNTGGLLAVWPVMRAHPHGRGEHVGVLRALGRTWGSSPRAWGTRTVFLHPDRQPGLIPTGVGNTCRPRPGKCCGGAHPHGRGEHEFVGENGPREDGSSPRAWGTRVGVGAIRLPSVAHPHGRGEHILDKYTDDDGEGSSPRAWGTRVRPGKHPRSGGLIPTGVGNTLGQSNDRVRAGAHPHGRGEHSSTKPRIQDMRGSSPRAWGTLPEAFEVLRVGGLIPTGVGNTAFCWRVQKWVEAHPHGRGEHSPDRPAGSPPRGSSPRAWGTLVMVPPFLLLLGLIPTGVGNTSGSSPASSAVVAHPHGRGEHYSLLGSRAPSQGSSPRAWGTQPERGPAGPPGGLIPTGVGNTYQVQQPATGKRGSSPRAWGTLNSPLNRTVD